MMSATLILETLGWVPVAWLVGVLLLVDRGRLARDGAALRIAGCAAAAVVIAAAAVANMWPVAALGLLWLRTEVFAHRHPIHEFQAHREQARLDRARRADQAELAAHAEPAGGVQVDGVQVGDPVPAPRAPAEPDLAHQGLAQLELGTAARTGQQKQLTHGHADPGQSDRRPRPPGPPRPRAGYGAGAQRHPSAPASGHGHGQRKNLGPRIVDAIFKLEVIIVAIVVLVIFGSWAQHQRIGFSQNANSSLCRLMGGC